MMNDDILRSMVEKGLADVTKRNVLEANRLYQQAKIINYTRTQIEPDIMTCWLRMDKRN